MPDAKERDYVNAAVLAGGERTVGLAPCERLARHEMLHEHLDELVACYLQHNLGAFPSATSVLDLMRWSNATVQNLRERVNQSADLPGASE